MKPNKNKNNLAKTSELNVDQNRIEKKNRIEQKT